MRNQNWVFVMFVLQCVPECSSSNGNLHFRSKSDAFFRFVVVLLRLQAFVIVFVGPLCAVQRGTSNPRPDFLKVHVINPTALYGKAAVAEFGGIVRASETSQARAIDGRGVFYPFS